MAVSTALLLIDEIEYLRNLNQHLLLLFHTSDNRVIKEEVAWLMKKYELDLLSYNNVVSTNR